MLTVLASVFSRPLGNMLSDELGPQLMQQLWRSEKKSPKMLKPENERFRDGWIVSACAAVCVGARVCLCERGNLES